MKRPLGRTITALMLVALLAMTIGCTAEPADEESTPTAESDSVEVSEEQVAEESDEGTTPSIDDEYKQMALDYITGEDLSDEGREASECWSVLDLLEGSLIFAGGQEEELAGASVETIKAALEAAYPNVADGVIDSYFQGCPCGGTVGVRFYEAYTMNNGKVLWDVEVSCSVHRPEAYARFLEQLAE